MLEINRDRCNGCKNAKISKCENICPGTLLIRDSENKITICDNSACWDCTACVKECPKQALCITLPFSICTSRRKLEVQKKNNNSFWQITTHENEVIEILGPVKNNDQ